MQPICTKLKHCCKCRSYQIWSGRKFRNQANKRPHLPHASVTPQSAPILSYRFLTVLSINSQSSRCFALSDTRPKISLLYQTSCALLRSSQPKSLGMALTTDTAAKRSIQSPTDMSFVPPPRRLLTIIEPPLDGDKAPTPKHSLSPNSPRSHWLATAECQIQLTYTWK
jgi:hypothetical protein